MEDEDSDIQQMAVSMSSNITMVDATNALIEEQSATHDESSVLDVTMADATFSFDNKSAAFQRRSINVGSCLY